MTLWLVYPLLIFAFGYGYMLGRSIKRIRQTDLLIEGKQLGYLEAMEKYGPFARSMSVLPPDETK